MRRFCQLPAVSVPLVGGVRGQAVEVLEQAHLVGAGRLERLDERPRMDLLPNEERVGVELLRIAATVPGQGGRFPVAALRGPGLRLLVLVRQERLGLRRWNVGSLGALVGVVGGGRPLGHVSCSPSGGS